MTKTELMSSSIPYETRWEIISSGSASMLDKLGRMAPAKDSVCFCAANIDIAMRVHDYFTKVPTALDNATVEVFNTLVDVDNWIELTLTA